MAVVAAGPLRLPKGEPVLAVVVAGEPNDGAPPPKLKLPNDEFGFIALNWIFVRLDCSHSISGFLMQT